MYGLAARPAERDHGRRRERMRERIVSSWLLLFGLGVAWVVVLVPDLLRRNAASRRSDTIGQFARKLSSLEQSAPVGVNRSNVVQFPGRVAQPGAYVGPAARPAERPAQRPVARGDRPVRRSAVQQRRQDVLSSLIAAALLSFLGSVSVGGALTMVHVVVDVALVLYLGALLTIKRREQMRARAGVLYDAPHQFSGVVPAYVERRAVR